MPVDTAFVNTGWNIVGGASFNVDSSSIVQIPSGLLQSSFYLYSGTYASTTTLEPGKGYWVKCAKPGWLVLVSNGSKQSK